MEPKALVYKSWDELVFENRNKAYGAYILRKAYKDKVLLAFGISIALFLAVFIAPTFLPATKVVKPDVILDPIVRVLKEPIIIRNPKPEAPAAPRPPVERIQRNDLPPVVTKDPVDVPPVTVERIAPLDESIFEGTGPEESVGVSTATTSTVIPVDLNKEYDIVQVMPEYIGGSEAMIKFLRKHLRYPSSARRTEKEGTVYVSFVVDGAGKVSKVAVVRGFHPDCDKEAMRVVSLLPNWKGGIQSGYPVSVRMVLPIKFKLD